MGGAAHGVEDANLRLRIEWLEAQVLRAAASGSGSASFAGPIVANEAAAAALNGLLDGEQVFVLSHRSIWTKRTGTAGVQGVPPLAANEVIATTDATGVLTRTTYSDPALRIGINDIFINPATGNNENTGLTAGTPIASGQELFRRWGWGERVVVSCNLTTSPDGFTNVNVQGGDLISPDSLEMVILLDANCSLRIRGGATTFRTGTLTAAPIAMNRAAPPIGGTRLRLTDAAAAALWAADCTTTNRRGRFTNGPAANGTFMAQVDVGGGAVDCSGCQTTNEPGFSQIATTVTPANGNTYVIETLRQVNFGVVDIMQSLNPTVGGFTAFANVIDCHIPATGAQPGWAPRTLNGVNLNFYQCTFNRSCSWLDRATALVACYTNEGWVADSASRLIISGGGARLLVGGSTLDGFFANSTFANFDQDFVSEQMPIFTTNDFVSTNFAVWNAGVVPGFNPGGHGLLLGTPGGGRGTSRFLGTFWGSGNGGVGIRVGAGCTAVGGPQNATGAGGDFVLGSRTTGWFFDNAAAIYNPGAGPLAFSWANLAAAQPAGFAGDAHAPHQDAHWVPAEAN